MDSPVVSERYALLPDRKYPHLFVAFCRKCDWHAAGYAGVTVAGLLAETHIVSSHASEDSTLSDGTVS